MLALYRTVMSFSGPVLKLVLNRRCRKNKEDPERLAERMGQPGMARPKGLLIWLHAASVGESQSALILIDALQKLYPAASFLVTSGTVTSAQIMKKRLPPSAFHQFYPLDHPQWTQQFLDHWRPDMVLWLESELWPNMLTDIKKRDIPAALINARLSEKSLGRWKKARRSAKKMLAAFKIFVTQTTAGKEAFEALGARNIIVGDNLKYAAAPLPCDQADLSALTDAIGDRPVWVFASTHAREEEYAARIHRHLRKDLPDLLTIIVPRHPERRLDIKQACERHDVSVRLRSRNHLLPAPEDDVYVADTLGELGLFYRLSPIACIGRSLSDDGGGGHNPIEAAQLECAVLHGPLVQNLGQIYKEMDQAGAALAVRDEKDLQARLLRLFRDEEGRTALQNKALSFTRQKSEVLDDIMNAIAPWLSLAEQTHQPRPKADNA